MTCRSVAPVARSRLESDVSLAKVSIVLAILGVVACTSLVNPGTQSIDGAYTVETPIQWRRRVESEKVEIWTSRGPAEDQLAFITGLAPGEPLLPDWGPFPRYEAGMTPQAIAQFVVNSYVLQYGHTSAAVRRTWPALFGKVAGFRFEYGYTTKFNIEVHGLGAGTVRDGRLYLICLEAAGEGLFKRLRPVAEQIMDSATF
jgi:hypothetical protein